MDSSPGGLEPLPAPTSTASAGEPHPDEAAAPLVPWSPLPQEPLPAPPPAAPPPVSPAPSPVAWPAPPLSGPPAWPTAPPTYSWGRHAVSQSSFRAGPVAHRTIASVLLGLGFLFVVGALFGLATELQGFLQADIAVRHLSPSNKAGSAVIGYLVIAAFVVVLAGVSERRWMRRLAVLRPPSVGEETGAPAPPSTTSRRRRWLLPMAARDALIDRRSEWAGAPDRAYDRLARLWAIAVIATLVLGVAAVVASSSSDGGLVRVGIGLGLVAIWLFALVLLVAWLLLRRLGQVVERRAALVFDGRFTEPVRPTLGFTRSGPYVVPAAAGLVLGLAAVTVASVPTTVACDASDDGCRVVTVPFDRAHPDDGRTLDVEYAVAPATGQRRGLLIVAVGGPGASGLAEMPSRLDEIDPAVRAAYDIVFFDQRGVGASGGLTCRDASKARYSDDDTTAARDFAEACLREIGQDPADMAVYGSVQAADDIDAIRAALGADRFVLYGESYGTRLAQVYASRHADRLSALVLDGAIDTTSSGIQFWTESAGGFDATLRATIAACDDDAVCRDDLGGRDGLSLLKNFLDHVGDGPGVRMPAPEGSGYEHVTRQELAAAIEGALYTEGGRADLQRGIAELARGDSTILGRLVQIDRETSPEGLAERGSLFGAVRSGSSPFGNRLSGAADSADSVASYYAIECADYDYPAGDAGDRAFEAAQQQADDAGIILADAVSQDQPCTHWPAHGVGFGSLGTPSVPTLVLAATTDPVTPPANAERIVARLSHATLVLSEGGPHVTWRAGDTCVDAVVKLLLLNGSLPGRTSCSDEVAALYAPLPPRDWTGLSDLDTMAAIGDETLAFPEMAIWDGVDRFDIACADGGSVELTTDGSPASGASSNGLAVQYRYSHCDMFGNFLVDGNATYDPGSGAFHFDGQVGGDRVAYSMDGAGRRQVDGTWGGRQVHDHD
jgi:pimeloyl-ACP methyl ester carboxylesterase